PVALTQLSALLLSQKNDCVQAAAAARQALAIDPNFADAWMHLSHALRSGGDRPGAVQASRRAMLIRSSLLNQTAPPPPAPAPTPPADAIAHPLNIIQIGCFDGDDHVFKFISENASQIHRAVLVEPLLAKLREAEARYRDYTFVE